MQNGDMAQALKYAVHYWTVQSFKTETPGGQLMMSEAFALRITALNRKKSLSDLIYSFLEAR